MVSILFMEVLTAIKNIILQLFVKVSDIFAPVS